MAQSAGGRRRLVRTLVAFLQSAGNAYLEAVTPEASPHEFNLLRPDRVTVVPGSRGWPAAYDYTVDGRTTRITR